MPDWESSGGNTSDLNKTPGCTVMTGFLFGRHAGLGDNGGLGGSGIWTSNPFGH